MPIPFLSSIGLNKNEVQDFKVFNLASDPTLTSGGDFGYFWLNTSGTKTLKFWDGANIRSLIDSTTISSSTAGSANDLTGGLAGSLPYQQAAGDTTFLGIGTASQVLTVNSGATAPQWLSQSSLSVGSATNKTGGNLGDLLVQTGSGTTSFLSAGTAGQVITSNGASPQYVNQSTLSVGSATTATTATNVAGGANGSILVQSGAGTTGQLAIGANGYILTSNGTTPGWSATIPSTSVSGLAASATTDTTNASNISSGTLGLARLSLASGQFYVGDGSNNPAATAKSSIPLSGFGNAAADINIGGFKITNSGTIGSGDADSTVATKGYVDSVAQGLDVKASCLVATTTNITLASPGAVTIDGIYSATDFTAGTTRILVKDQSAPAENGIYIWQGPSSAMTRSADANTWDELVGAFTFVERGTANADSGWVCTVNAGGTLGSTAVTFVKFSQAGSYTAGNGIVQSGTSFNFAQSTPYTAGQIPFAGGTFGTSSTTIGFDSILVWDDQNNRLGVGTSLPAAKIHIADSQLNSYAYLQNDQTLAQFRSIQLVLANGPTAFGSGNRDWRIFNLGTSATASDFAIDYWNGSTVSEKFRIASDGVCTWSNVGGVAVTAMTLNGMGLGVGVSPLARVHSVSNIAAANHDWTSQFVAPTVGLLAASNDSSAWIRIATYNSNPTHDPYLNFLTSGGQNWSIGIDNSDSDKLKVAMAAGFSGSNEFLTIDSTGSVGIGTTSPNRKLEVAAGTGGAALRLTNTNGNSGIEILTASDKTSWRIGAQYNVDQAFEITPSTAVGGTTFSTPAVVVTSSGNVGIGTATPIPYAANARVLHIDGGANSSEIRLTNNTTGTANTDGGLLTMSGSNLYVWNNENASVIFGTNNGTKATLDGSGNLGLGVTPSAWQANWKVLQFVNGSSIGNPFNGAGTFVGSNTYRNSSGDYVRLDADAAALYVQLTGSHRWHVAGTSTAGSTIPSFSTGSQAMILDQSGNLGLGVTPKSWAASYKAVQIGSYSSIQDVSGFTIIGCNYYNDGVDKSLNGGAVSRYLQNSGAHTWQRVASSTANNTIAFTDSMVLDASGNLALGTSTANFRADIQNASGAAILRLKGGTGAAQGSAVYLTYAGSANTLLGIGDRATILGGTPDQLACIYSGVALTFEISGAERLRLKTTGQVNFFGLASDPAGAAGDVYYNSGSNLFRVYDTGWKTLPRKYVVQLSDGSVTVVGNAYTLTHNFASKDVTISIRRTTDDAVVLADVTMPTTNTATVTFASAITAANYYVTVIG